MDAREQAPLAPLDALGIRAERAAEERALRLERRERNRHVGFAHGERARDVGDGHRPKALHARTKYLAKGFFAIPRLGTVGMKVERSEEHTSEFQSQSNL